MFNHNSPGPTRAAGAQTGRPECSRIGESRVAALGPIQTRLPQPKPYSSHHATGAARSRLRRRALTENHRLRTSAEAVRGSYLPTPATARAYLPICGPSP